MFLIKLFTYSLSKNDKDYLLSTAKVDLALMTGAPGYARPEESTVTGVEMLVTKAK